ncbi:hypothetical protein DFJ74DRAFT_660075 [Hyaloraphidium curvatum]|nr:hypothetical protein DFJ74DRAFT_660075 [Hyaloraphidium curvatum]
MLPRRKNAAQSCRPAELIRNCDPGSASPQSATQSPAKFGPTEIIEGAMKEAHAHDPATLEIRLRQLREKGPVRYAIWNKWRFLKDKASLSEAKKKEKLVARFRAKFPQLWLRYDPSTEATAGDNELAASEALQRRGVMSTAAESADAGDADGPSAQAEERAAKRRRAAFAARGTEMVYSSDVEEFEAGRSGGEGDSDGEFLPACEQGEEDEGEERSKRARREPSDAL